MAVTKKIEIIEQETRCIWDSKGASEIPQDALLDQIRLGNHAAFKYIYKKHYNELCIFASGFTKNDQIAEDLVQNVMIKIWEKKKTISISVSLKRYLYKAVYNQFINYYKKQKKEISMQQELRANVLINLADEDETTIQNKITLINLEIEKLPKRCKEVFIMSKRQGLKYREIAQELNISIGTVEAHITKALKAIRYKLYPDHI